eukprot:CAMPEP_0197180830 /NCGR_PEP_ID=MMETSP1423-20130617/5299_1 /TAXON_ID=476441 /ORGANISM="Pseudo-nitzschia heimii, Strain UNC1101" /LENGTH=483 /DNA_ID=CAMNT_0042630959 /DNA_START=38 /DNA_END=1489 /DNA_ORIENTATION=-
MTLYGALFGRMRYKSVAISGIIGFRRKASSLRDALFVEARRTAARVDVHEGVVIRTLTDGGRSKRMQPIQRERTQHRSKSLLSYRGGETGTGDKATTKTSIGTEDKRREVSSSSSSSSSSDAANHGNHTKNNQRATNPIGSRTYQVSVGTEQGYRSYMEDEHYVSNDGDFAAVFDGHGGPAVSRYLRKNLYANVQAFLPLTVFEKPGGRSFAENENGTGGDTKDAPQADADADADENLIQDRRSSPSLSISSSRRQKSPTLDDYANALESALEKVDSEILKISHWSFQGSTAIVIWLHEEHEERAPNDDGDREVPGTQRTILAANVGDSRAVLCRGDKAWDLSRDHKPNDPTEKSRIESFGGSVIWCGDVDKFGVPIEDRGIYRVNGNLALSRAIGDRSERPHVTAEPEIISVPVEEGDQFVIVATDGLWDVMDSDDAVNYVRLSLKAGVSKTEIADVMVQEAMRLGTYDNVTVVIIWIGETP